MKEEDFIVGNWYKFNNDRFTFYAKISAIKDLKLFFEDGKYIDSNNKYTLATYINIEKILKVILLENLSEIQEFLPDNHPDKFKFSIINNNDGNMDYLSVLLNKLNIK